MVVSQEVRLSRLQVVAAGVSLVAMSVVGACSDDDGGSDEDEQATSISQDAGGGADDAGGDDGDGALQVDEVDEAMAAVDDELGGEQAYFEVTASPNDVRLYVQVDRQGDSAVEPYLYVDGELAPLGEAEPAEGNTFTAGEVDFQPGDVLDGVNADLPGATLRSFSVVGTSGDEVRYGIYAQSSRGGTLDVTVAGDGEVLEAGDVDSEIVPAPTEPAGG